MQFRRLAICSLVVLLLASIRTFGQRSNDMERLKYQRALQEIEGSITDTGKLDDPLMVVSVKARAANLMWRYDRKRAQGLFLELWSYINQHQSDSFDQDEARTVLLRCLYPNNPGLATKLLKEIGERQTEEPSLRAQVTGTDPNLRRLANVSAGLVDQDPTLAARLLEQNLSVSITPTALSVLSRMKERNPILTNYVVSQTLEHIRNRPSIIALTGLHLLTAYLFPSEPYMADSPEIASSDDVLRLQYFSVSYEVLRSSLEESDAFLIKEKHYKESDLRFRALYQGQIAMVLAALAPRFSPQLTEELIVLASRLSGGMPSNVANLSRYVAARLSGDQSNTDNPDVAIALAISRGDFDEARRLIDKIEAEERKKALTQTLLKAEFKFRLRESDFPQALIAARGIDNVNVRVLLLLQLARAAYRKDDNSESRIIISEARTSIANAEKDGLRARVLLSFASEVSAMYDSDAVDLLNTAVSAINSLTTTDKDTDSSAQPQSTGTPPELNDPRSFAESPDLQRAFASVARIDFDGALLAADRLTALPVQLVARLAASEVALTKHKPGTGAQTKKVPSAGPVKRAP